ncbi:MULTISPECIES: lipase family protein [Pseudomonas syringae group]|uniref:lipase family protein n=1 Tax=Pseudomonas syringae group TaxID=136849 RepID=UPI000F06659A|nr:alpha/beta fold hydrolase [Pseudomonas viridiflava]MBD8809167.1 alpha/beta fold hydrolase [Pseudomonas syringae]
MHRFRLLLLRSISALFVLFLTLEGGCAVAAVMPPGGAVVPDFYTWTDGVPDVPGTVLRSEPLPMAENLGNAVINIRFLYTSTDGLDSARQVVVSAALFIPPGSPPPHGWPLMAWAHGTVGSADLCAPSFSGRSPRDIRYLNEWLAQGYAVVATDYQGLGTPGPHPYGLSRPLAFNIIDSIRAVMSSGFDLSGQVVVFGQSQGGRAAFATAVYAGTYAPELKIVGVVATGTPYAGVQKRLGGAGGSMPSTLSYNLLRLSTGVLLDPSFVPTDYLSDRAIPAFELSQSACLHAIERRVISDNLTFDNSFKRSPASVLDRINLASAYPTLRSDIPIFIGTGGRDHEVSVAQQAALVADACKAGSRIEWHFYPQLDHSGTVNGSLADSLKFVRKAFSGEDITGNCKAVIPRIQKVDSQG